MNKLTALRIKRDDAADAYQNTRVNVALRAVNLVALLNAQRACRIEYLLPR